MNLNYSIDRLDELIRENEKGTKHFKKLITPRFSDCIYGRKIHFSKIFEFFEMARFDIMNSFYLYYKHRKNYGESINLGNFVVVRVQCDKYEALERPIYGDVSIETTLIIHNSPLLEFDQIAYDVDSGEMMFKANIRIAIVDETYGKVVSPDRDVLTAMLEFINLYGKEKTI